MLSRFMDTPALLPFRGIFSGAISLMVLLGGLNFAELQALPPFIPLETRVRESDLIIVGDIIQVRSRKLNRSSRAASIRIRVEKVLKGKLEDSKELTVSFLVFPNSYESRLREPPPRGRYFIFLIKQKVKDRQGRTGEAVVLYRPEPFSYEPYNSWNIKIMRSLLGNF